MKIYTLKKGNCTSQDLNENSFPFANACYYALIYFQMAVFTKMPGTWRLRSERGMSSAQQWLPEEWRCSKSSLQTQKAHGHHCLLSNLRQHALGVLRGDCTSNTTLCGEKGLKAALGSTWGGSGLLKVWVQALLGSRCVITWTIPPATLWDQASQCSRQCLSILSHCSRSCSGARPAQSCPGRVWLLQWPSKSSPDLQCPGSQLKRFVSEKFKPLRLFQISLCEGIICFKEVIAVIFDFHQKDILKPGKEIWNEFAVLHLSKCYSHWPSKEKHSVR